MATILALAGSNSSKSINHQLVHYTTSLVKDHKVRLLKMSDHPFPMYSEDYERERGYVDSLVELMEDIRKADGIIISVNEHNGNPSAYFKNLTDWLSRIDRKFLDQKSVLLMSTSTGRRGGIGSLEVVHKTLLRFGAIDIQTFSLPLFKENFEVSKGILSPEKASEHRTQLAAFLSTLP